MARPIPLMNDGNVVGNFSDSEKRVANLDIEGKRPSSNSTVLHRSLHQDPLQVVSAKGHLLHLSNGQEIFDATGGAAVACLGHGDERYAYV